MEWISVKDTPPPREIYFLACMFGKWVGKAIYSYHYDAPHNEPPSKYGFFYVSDNPENESVRIRSDATPFPITHWMPLPSPPIDNVSNPPLTGYKPSEEVTGMSTVFISKE